jgi:hypothetical protein
MGKPKTSGKSGKGGFIDMREISETLDKNEDVIANLIHNYNHAMVRIGDRKHSNTHKVAYELVQVFKKGNINASSFIFDRDVFSVLNAKAK